MKKIKIFVLLIGGTLTALSQSNNFPTNGNVTINDGNLVQTGAYNLLTQNAVKLKNYLLFDADGDFAGGNYYTIQDHSSGNYLRLGYGFNDNLTINSQGRVGIGTSSSKEIFQIGDRWTFHDGGHKIIGYNHDYNSGSKRIFNDEVSTMRFTDYGDIRFETSGSDVAGSSINWSYTLVLKNGGNVGIGVLNPDSKLVVDGKIRAEEVKVEIINGPDYVFENGYELRTLQETKEYISNNKHLPEIPSAKEMEENGINLGDMNMRLLKKIEELTLYQIELLEKVEELQSKVEKLKNKYEYKRH